MIMLHPNICFWHRLHVCVYWRILMIPYYSMLVISLHTYVQTNTKELPMGMKFQQFFFFFKIGQPRPLFRLFSVFFKQTTQFLQQIYVKKCPSSIRCRDSNPRPSERESLPITTRPGLPPNSFFFAFTCESSSRWCHKIAHCCYYGKDRQLRSSLERTRSPKRIWRCMPLQDFIATYNRKGVSRTSAE